MAECNADESTLVVVNPLQRRTNISKAVVKDVSAFNNFFTPNQTTDLDRGDLLQEPHELSRATSLHIDMDIENDIATRHDDDMEKLEPEMLDLWATSGRLKMTQPAEIVNAHLESMNDPMRVAEMSLREGRPVYVVKDPPFNINGVKYPNFSSIARAWAQHYAMEVSGFLIVMPFWQCLILVVHGFVALEIKRSSFRSLQACVTGLLYRFVCQAFAILRKDTVPDNCVISTLQLDEVCIGSASGTTCTGTGDIAGKEGWGLLDRNSYESLQTAAYVAVDEFRERNAHQFGETSHAKLPWQPSEKYLEQIFSTAAHKIGILEFTTAYTPALQVREAKRTAPKPTFMDVMQNLKKRRRKPSGGDRLES